MSAAPGKSSAADLEPGGAFLKYAVGMRDSRPGVKFTVGAAQFCGYSSQQLTGTFQGPSGTFDFADRLTHIWTNTKKYLVAIQLQGPAGAAGSSLRNPEPPRRNSPLSYREKRQSQCHLLSA